MKIPPAALLERSPDKVFLALGQTIYVGQLFEVTMLELMAAANELLDGAGDGTKFQASLESLSRSTLGQLLHSFRARADIRSDIESLLSAGLEARNFVVHHFANHFGDDLADEVKHPLHQQTLYEKCAAIMAANDTALSILQAVSQLQSQQTTARI